MNLQIRNCKEVMFKTEAVLFVTHKQFKKIKKFCEKDYIIGNYARVVRPYDLINMRHLLNDDDFKILLSAFTKGMKYFVIEADDQNAILSLKS